MVLSGARGDDGGSIGEKLLQDIRAVFRDDQVDRAFSEVLVERLVAMEDRPWAEYSHGRPLTKSKLARKLHSFGVMPRTVRIGEERAKGYLLEDFRDAFARYLPLQTVPACQPLQTADEMQYSNRDPTEVCHVSRTAETAANSGLSRCHDLQGDALAQVETNELVEIWI